MELLSGTNSDTVESGAAPVSALGIEARLGFLRKTYGLFTLGVGTAGVGAFAGMSVLSGAFTRVHPLAFLVGYLVAYFAVYALRKVPVVNIIALLAFTFLSGMTLSPLLAGTLLAKGIAIGTANIVTAFAGTTVAFGGLTAYVFISRKDFSYLGGFLLVGMLGLLVFAIGAIFFPISNPVVWIGFNLIGLMLMCGFVLYDTSMILHHYAEDEYVLSALALFLDFILIFRYLLRLLNSRN